MPDDLVIDTHAALKQHIAALEEENTTLLAKFVRKPYITQPHYHFLQADSYTTLVCTPSFEKVKQFAGLLV